MFLLQIIKIMEVEFITKQDLKELKSEIAQSIASINSDNKTKKWLRSKDVRKMLGISPGTLQNMRIHGHIPYSKLGGTLFYDNDEIKKILNDNKSSN